MAMHEYQKKQMRQTLTIAALIILPIIGFVAGMQYQKGNNDSTSTATTNTTQNGQFPGGGGGFGGGGGQAPNIGEVKAITDTSITIESQFDNSDVTLAITSSTEIQDGDDNATVSDIKVGDTAIAIADEDDEDTAAQIIINPQMPSGGGFGGGGSQLN